MTPRLRVIYMLGEGWKLSGGTKDGSPSYFQSYKKNKRNMKG